MFIYLGKGDLNEPIAFPHARLEIKQKIPLGREAMAVCKTDQPRLRELGPGRAVACHLHAG